MLGNNETTGYSKGSLHTVMPLLTARGISCISMHRPLFHSWRLRIGFSAKVRTHTHTHTHTSTHRDSFLCALSETYLGFHSNSIVTARFGERFLYAKLYKQMGLKVNWELFVRWPGGVVFHVIHACCSCKPPSFSHLLLMLSLPVAQWEWRQWEEDWNVTMKRFSGRLFWKGSL